MVSGWKKPDHGETQEKKKKHIQVIHRIPEPVKKMLESGETLSDEMIIQAIQSDSKN